MNSSIKDGKKCHCWLWNLKSSTTRLVQIINWQFSCKLRSWRLCCHSVCTREESICWRSGRKQCRLFLCIISPTYWSIAQVINFLQTKKSRYCLRSSKKYPLRNTTAHYDEKSSLILETNTLAKYLYLKNGENKYCFLWTMVKINIHLSFHSIFLLCS